MNDQVVQMCMYVLYVCMYVCMYVGLSYRKGADLAEDFRLACFNLPYQQIPSEL